MKGFYRSKYSSPSGEEKYGAVTQFEVHIHLYICFLCINVSKILRGLKQQILEKFLKFAKFNIQRGLYLYMNVQGQNVSIRQKLFVSNSVPVISISTQISGLRN